MLSEQQNTCTDCKSAR